MLPNHMVLNVKTAFENPREWSLHMDEEIDSPHEFCTKFDGFQCPAECLRTNTVDGFQCVHSVHNPIRCR